MRPPMMHTATKLIQTRNEYGDFVGDETETLPCHFRYITAQVTGDSNEVVQSDAMAWFEPDSGVQRKDVITFDGEKFRVERVIKARRLRDPQVLFLKVELLKYGNDA